ncbi:MAG: hypothetical protein HQK51_03640 [Oligoflexia bacterium]|nr:hypothetical protein [Oligoflexia bacterium]
MWRKFKLSINSNLFFSLIIITTFLFLFFSCSKQQEESYVNVVIKVPQSTSNDNMSVDENLREKSVEDSFSQDNYADNDNDNDISTKEVIATSAADYNCFAVFVTYPELPQENQCINPQGVIIVRPNQFIGFVERGNTISTMVKVGAGRAFHLMALKSTMGRCPNPATGDMDGDANKSLMSNPEIIGSQVQDIPANLTEQTVTLWGSFADRKVIKDCSGPLFQFQMREQATATSSSGGILALRSSAVKFDLRSSFNVSSLVIGGTLPYTYSVVSGYESKVNISTSWVTMVTSYTPTPGISTDAVLIDVKDAFNDTKTATLYPRMRKYDYNFMPNTATPNYFQTPVPLPNGWTYVRNGTGSANGDFVTNYDGALVVVPTNTPRFEYEQSNDYLAGTSAGNTPTPIGFLIESYALNYLCQSDTFASSSWTYTPAALTFNSDDNTSEAKDLTSATPMADLVSDVTSDGVAFLLQTLVASPTPNVDYVFSVFARKSASSGANPAVAIQIHDSESPDSGAIINLDTGVVAPINIDGTPLSRSSFGMKRYKNGWVRVWLTRMYSTPAPISVKIYPAFSNTPVTSSSSVVTADPTATGGVYLFGAQFEGGSAPSSYVRTFATPIARNPDVFNYAYSAAATPLDDSRGTLYVKWYKAYNNQPGMTFLDIVNPTVTPGPAITPLAHSVVHDYSSVCIHTKRGNTDSDSRCCINTAYMTFGINSIIYAYDTTKVYAYTSLAGSKSCILPSYNGSTTGMRKINLGGRDDGTYQMNAHIQRLIYWDDLLDGYALPQVTP